MRHLLLAACLSLMSSLASAQTAPYPGAPLCGTHNDRAWHSLWNAQEGCHYDHQHGDDPNAVNDIFGGSLFEIMGGSISHPWQTFSDAGFENDLKHAGYFWHVKRNLPCAAPGCITDFRLLVHQHPSGRDAAVRFHSAVLEARVTQAGSGQYGSVQIPGMWVDFGHLLIDGVRVIDVGLDAEPGRHKQHSATGFGQIIWYGATRATHTPDGRGRLARLITISTSVHETWDVTAVANPSDPTDYVCYPTPRCSANGTLLRPHFLRVHGTAARRADVRPVLDPDGNGVIDGSFWFDRYGVPQAVGLCGVPSLDCVPVTFQRISINTDYDCESVCAGLYTEQDVFFPGPNGRPVTSGWSQPRP